MTTKKNNNTGNLGKNWKTAADPGTYYPRIDLPTGSKYPFQLSGTVLGQNPNDPTFIKLHLGLTKEQFSNAAPARLPVGYVIEEVVGADPETMADLFFDNLDTVGGPYGWSARKKYQPQNRADIVEKMKDPETRLFHFKVNGGAVGFCLLAAIKPDWQSKPYEQGMNKMDAVMEFARQEKSKDWPRPVEIYKIGLDPNKVGQGYGSAFLKGICNIVFRKHYNMIYLDTRDTNPVGTEEFYAKNGFRVFFGQSLNNDLAHAVLWPPVLTPAAQAAQQNQGPANNNTPQAQP